MPHHPSTAGPCSVPIYRYQLAPDGLATRRQLRAVDLTRAGGALLALAVTIALGGAV